MLIFGATQALIWLPASDIAIARLANGCISHEMISQYSWVCVEPCAPFHFAVPYSFFFVFSIYLVLLPRRTSSRSESVVSNPYLVLARDQQGRLFV